MTTVLFKDILSAGVAPDLLAGCTMCCYIYFLSETLCPTQPYWNSKVPMTQQYPPLIPHVPHNVPQWAFNVFQQNIHRLTLHPSAKAR